MKLDNLVRSRNGNLHVLILLDCFSKYVILLPIRNVTATTIVRSLERIWQLFGPPVSLATDNASYFTSSLFTEMCFSWSIKAYTSSPYHPQGNQVERFNRNLKSALTALHSHHHSDWEDEIAFLNLGFNSTPHSATHSSPALVFMGRHLSHPLLNQWGIPDIHAPLNDRERQQLWQQVTVSLSKARAAVASKYNVGRQDSPFHVGDLVL